MSDAGVAFVRIVPSMQGFAGEVSKGFDKGLTKPATEAGKKAGKGFVTGFGDELQKGGKAIAGFGDKLTKGITLPIVGLGALSLSAARDFNAGMANIATLIPGNTARIGELKTGIMDLGVEVGKSTDDLSEGMYNVISAFGDSSESLQLLDINARAATAGMATTTDAINLTSAVTKGYGDTSAEAVQKASDLALLTVRLGQTTFPELASSIGAVIPFAESLNVTQEELFASMATFTGVTGTASEVATQMRGSMQALMAPTGDAAKAIEEAGFASGAAAVEELGLAGAVGILTDAAAASGDPLQKYISSLEGQTFAMGLAGAQAGDYEQKLKDMAGAAGVTDEAFAEATEGVNAAGFQWEQAKVRAGNMAIQLGDGLAPALIALLDAAEPVIAKVSELATQFSEADPATQKMILGAVGIVAALGPVLSIGGRVISVVGGTVKAFAAFGRGSVTVVKGVARMGVAIGRGVVGFARLSVAAVKAAARLAATVARAAAQAAVSFARLAMSAARAGLAVARAAVQMAAQAAAATARVVASIATQIARWVVLGVQALLHAAKVALAWLISLGPIGLIAAAIIAIAALVITHFDTVKKWVLIAFNAVKAAVMAVFDWIVANWPLLLAIITGPIGMAVLLVVKHWDTIKAAFTAVKDWIAARIDDIVSFFVALPGRIASFIASAYQFLMDKADEAKGWVGDRIDDVVSFFTGLPGRIGRAISSLASKLKQPFVDAFNAIRNKWNDTVGGFGISIPDWVPRIGGNSFKIPRMHQGGTVPGPAGSEQLILAQAGETVTSRRDIADAARSRSRSAVDPAGLLVRFDVTGADQEMARLMRRMVMVKGRGNVQVAFGQKG